MTKIVHFHRNPSKPSKVISLNSHMKVTLLWLFFTNNQLKQSIKATEVSISIPLILFCLISISVYGRR